MSGGSQLAERVYSTGEIAGICRMTKHTILSAIQRGEMVASTTPGGHNRIREGDAIVFLRRHNIPVELLTGGSNKVLVMDRDRFVCELIGGLLAEDKLEVDIATGPFTAGASAESARPSLVILDIRSAGPGALDLISEVKSSDQCRRSKLLAVLSGPPGRSPDDVIDAGADDVIRKPFTVEELRGKVRKLLGLAEPAAVASGGE